LYSTASSYGSITFIKINTITKTEHNVRAQFLQKYATETPIFNKYAKILSDFYNVNHQNEDFSTITIDQKDKNAKYKPSLVWYLTYEYLCVVKANIPNELFIFPMHTFFLSTIKLFPCRFVIVFVFAE